MGFKDVIKQIGRGTVRTVANAVKPKEQYVDYTPQRKVSFEDLERMKVEQQALANARAGLQREKMQRLREMAQQRYRQVSTVARTVATPVTSGRFISKRGQARTFNVGRWTRGSRGSGGMGRPRGSVKYFIPGKGPVGVFEYRAWVRDQKRANQLRFQQALAKNPQLAQQIVMQQAQGSSQVPYTEVNQPLPVNNTPQTTSQYINPVQPHGMNLWASGYSMTGNMMPMNSGGLNLNTPFMNQEQNQPKSDYYMDVNFLTGKQTLRKKLY